jgi:polar amino acid transport system substrate-binding protein
MADGYRGLATAMSNGRASVLPASNAEISIVRIDTACQIFLSVSAVRRSRRPAAQGSGGLFMPFKKIVVAMVLFGLATFGASAQEQVLKVGSTPTGIPFTFLDTKTNTIEGVMVDLIKAIAKDAGFKVEIEGMTFATLIPSLTANKIDIIAAAMYITAPRKEVIDFSGPVYTYGEGLVVPKTDTKDYKAFDELKGETVGAQKGTAYVEPLQKTGLFPEVKIYDSIPAIMADVNTGRLKAGFADKPILAYNLKQGLFPEVRLVNAYVSTITGSVGIGVRKSDGELLAKINASLDKLTKDGTVKKILGKWGLE